MDKRRISLVLFWPLLMMFRVLGDQEGLSLNFYDQSCPQLEGIVENGLRYLSVADPTIPAAMLRLMFHDCQVQGCDASILLDSENSTMASEMASSKNFAIQKRELVSTIKSTVELACPGQVSCADILVLAAREGVAMSGGPRIRVPLGRRDSSSPPSLSLADASLPPPNIGVDGMLQIFASKGMTNEESVAIMGAHTLGVTHCHSLGNSSLESIKLMCPVGSALDAATFLVNDPTSFLFDNSYYVNALSGGGILRIDAEMPLDPRTAPIVQSFAGDQYQFFRAFSSAFVKLSSSQVLSGRKGVIRRTCNHF